MERKITLREYEEIRAFLRTMEIIYKDFTPQIIHLYKILGDVKIIELKNLYKIDEQEVKKEILKDRNI